MAVFWCPAGNVAASFNRQVMELAENLKMRLDSPVGEAQQDRGNRGSDLVSGSDTGSNDEAESQMRKALGLLGEGQRHRPDPERMEQPSRMGDRFNGGLHRRRFVQDGDIPVTVLRRDQGHELPAARGTAPVVPPTNSRLQRTEAALAAETAAREKAERSLAEAQAVARDLQTKIGHAELAKNEAIETLRRERDVLAQLRAEAVSRDEQLRDALEQARAAEHVASAHQEQLLDERNGRRTAEKALRAAEAARDAAELLVRNLSQETPAPRRSRPSGDGLAAPAKSQRSSEVPAVEPEPVKWWLNAKPASKRR